MQILIEPLDSRLQGVLANDVICDSRIEPVDVNGHVRIDLREDEPEHQKNAKRERTGHDKRPAKRCRSHKFRQAHGE